MKQILLGVIIVAMWATCSERESLKLEKRIQKLRDQPQLFTITNDQSDTIDATNGTRLIIPPHTFVHNDGREPNKPIQIELVEVFNKSDMILNGLSTISNGHLLESFGMIHLSASSAGKELKIRDNSTLTVTIPNKREGSGGELFYGTEADGALNWEYAGKIPDTTFVIETIMPLSGNRASLKRTTYKFVKGFKEFVSDTTFTIKYACCTDSTAGAEEGIYIPRSYGFEVTKLGWINCDRFLDVTDKTDLEIELKNFSQPIGYLVFNNISSIMQIWFDEKGKAIATNLPVNYHAELIVLDEIKGDLMWAKQSIKIGTGKMLSVETNKIKADELKAELKKLDK